MPGWGRAIHKLALREVLAKRHCPEVFAGNHLTGQVRLMPTGAPQVQAAMPGCGSR
jgi:hypothetical protein